MSNLKRTKAEYGGFLPFELNPGKESFAKYEPWLMRFNTVKASLYYLFRAIDIRRIYIPYYYCPSTTEAIKKVVSEVFFYHIDENLMPIDLQDESDAAVLLVDYFGIRSREVIALAQSFKKAEVVLDLAHSFYTEPLIKEKVHCVYSAKKLFGIPDGSYLVSKVAVPSEETLTDAASYVEYLVMTYERGTNAAYSKKKETDQFLSANYAGMSKLALGLLENVDYDRVYNRRRENYEFLRQHFEKVNELGLPESAAAYQFPLLQKGKGQTVKKILVEEKIFVSTLWTGENLIKSGSEFELTMSRDAVFLPMDQRYDLADMMYIASKVDEILEKLEQ